MTWLIESGIPIPDKKQGKSRNRTGLSKALMSMEIGQSMLLGHGSAWISGPLGRINLQTGMRFVTRSTDDGLRVWRVE